jgi:hypothetical protein
LGEYEIELFLKENNMIISNIFNAETDKRYCAYNKDVKLQNPFTFIINFGDFKMLPDIIGFDTKLAALKYCGLIKDAFDIDKYVAVVLKNADFIEGRGPMLLDSVFKSPEKAYDYIKTQEGIYGSKQYQNLSYGVNIHGKLYGSISYNGYDIKLTKIN